MGAGILGAIGGLGGSLTELMPNYVGQGMNYLGTGLLTGNWGGTSKERKNVITDQRKLRKTAYQDMTYSLQKAGLNPILALGSSPGHASAQQVATSLNQNPRADVGPSGVGSAIAANRQAGVAEGKAPSEINKNLMEAALRRTNEVAAQMGIPQILQQYEINNLLMDKTRAEIGNISLLGEVYRAEAEQKGASAKELDQRTREYIRGGLPGQQTIQGLIAAYLRNEIERGPINNGKLNWMTRIKESLEGPKPISERFNDRGIPIPEK